MTPKRSPRPRPSSISCHLVWTRRKLYPILDSVGRSTLSAACRPYGCGVEGCTVERPFVGSRCIRTRRSPSMPALESWRASHVAREGSTISCTRPAIRRLGRQAGSATPSSMGAMSRSLPTRLSVQDGRFATLSTASSARTTTRSRTARCFDSSQPKSLPEAVKSGCWSLRIRGECPRDRS